eukprot:4769190-Pyramimonas_sp.AAC.1
MGQWISQFATCEMLPTPATYNGADNLSSEGWSLRLPGSRAKFWANRAPRELAQAPVSTMTTNQPADDDD